MFNFFPFNLTPEQKAAMDAAEEREEMVYDEFRHSTIRLMDELTEDQLVTLRGMLRSLMGQTSTPIAAHWEGLVSGALKYRFGICPSCDVNHELELESEIKTMTDKTSDEVLPNFRDLTPDEIALMEKYHLDDLRIEGTNELVGFMCTGIKGWNRPCGMKYPSIEDRMLKGPESCSGCFVRMGQG